MIDLVIHEHTGVETHIDADELGQPDGFSIYGDGTELVVFDNEGDEEVQRIPFSFIKLVCLEEV